MRGATVPGMAKRTIVEIADRVGVSPATVSRALNNVPGVSPDKRRRILRVAAELNYHPNAIARSLLMYTPNEATGPVAAYLDWIKSDTGQCIIARLGYAPVRPLDCPPAG